ncbi:MAG: hypothetical protein IPK32_09000 [Verrucomicrobiaceae bacterium]|nr:hypothetical protein [Verrucomicrobiaceae bacterium]
MRALIKDPRLSAEDAARLLTLIEQHPHAEPAARLEVISTLMRLLPEQREEFIRREVARFESRDHVGERGGLVELAAWLAEHHAYTELHRLIPRHLARSSRELYTALVKALASEGRWQDMKSLLNEERPPVSPTLIKLWLADAESHLQPDGREARRQILLAIDCARTAHEAEELELASGLAERLGWTDIALQAVKYLRPEAPHRQGDLLSRARGLAARSQDTHSLLEITRDLLALHPESTQYADDLAYLRLLLGEEMEIVSLGGKKLPSFYAALNAYRLGDGAALPQLLTHTSNTEGLPAGRRAVLSGLLAKAGETARAFQIAEKVPDALLLDEERVFLKMAR